MPEKKNSAAADIQVKNDELENYFANTIIPQLYVDADLILRKFTPPAMTHFNLSTGDLGKPMAQVKDNIRYPTVIENIQEVIETGEILEKEIQTLDRKWYQMNILPYKIRKENRNNGVIITFVEITQRIRILRDLEKLNVEHETLMFALSHDVKQPLTTLLLLEKLLGHAFDNQDGELFRRHLGKLGAASKTIKDLINYFVEASDSSIEWEKKVERINIESTVIDITTALRSEEFTSRHFKTDFQTSEILFSRNNLRSIVYNLINNAIKYRDPGKELEIQISTRKTDGFVLLQVRDNGKGIAPEQQEKIFRRGHQIDPGHEGTGMGLYIIRRMLESMGSSISLESTPGEGSTFSVYFKSVFASQEKEA